MQPGHVSIPDAVTLRFDRVDERGNAHITVLRPDIKGPMVFKPGEVYTIGIDYTILFQERVPADGA